MAQRNSSIISMGARIAGLAMLAAAGGLMAGCAEQRAFPSFGQIIPVDKTLTPEQRQAEMKEMAKEQQTHTNEAAREIEQR